MDYPRLFELADQARRRPRLSDADVAFIRDEVPDALAAFPHVHYAERIDHPSGFTVKGAPVRTFTRGALLLAGQKALGRRFGGHPFYEHVEAYTALAVMRANFDGGAPKGAFCCSQCTLALLPVLEAGAIRHFDCAPLARNVRDLIETGGWRFASPPKRSMLAWATDGPS
jgi:hypothetical protein